MAKKYRFELNRQGVKELMQSSAMKSICTEAANRVAERAGDGYEVTTMVGATRVNARVSPANAHAYYSNLKYNTLLKALGGLHG